MFQLKTINYGQKNLDLLLIMIKIGIERDYYLK